MTSKRIFKGFSRKQIFYLIFIKFGFELDKFLKLFFFRIRTS